MLGYSRKGFGMKKLKILPIILLTSFLILSCSKRAIGYFVAIWPPEKSFIESGEVVKVISQSEIRNIYVLEKDGSKTREEIPKYTGRFFNKKKDAEKFSSQYNPYVDLFAYSETSLNIRVSPDVSSNREYRLRPNQVVKIINKMPEPSLLNNVSGYWMEVLTEDGFSGYCFDKYLTVYKQKSGLSQKNSDEKFLNSFFDNIWYPAAYMEIIDSEKIVIEKLSTGECLSPDRNNKKIVIQTGKERIEFSFSNILFLGNNTFGFAGSPVEIIFHSANKIYIKYTYMGVDYLSSYTTLEKPIAQYIEMEIGRRNSVLDLFYKRGRYLTSELYGAIKLEDKRKFIWTGYVNLVPDVIPFGYGSSGTIKNNYFLSDNINKNFDGILSFSFDTAGKEIVVAYIFVDNGVQFTHIPKSNIEGNIISSLPDDSHVFYFRQNLLPQNEE